MAAIKDLEGLRQAVRQMPAEEIFSYLNGHNAAGEAQFYLLWISRDRTKLHYWDLEKGHAPEARFKAVIDSERLTIVDRDASRRKTEQRLPGIQSVRSPIPSDVAEGILLQDIAKERRTGSVFQSKSKPGWMRFFSALTGGKSSARVAHDAGDTQERKTGPGGRR